MSEIKQPISRSKTLEVQAANLSTSKKGLKFSVKIFGWIRISFTLKYVTAWTLFAYSKQVLKMADIDKDADTYAFVVNNAKDMKRVARIAALGICNGPVKAFFFSRLIAYILFISDMDAEGWNTLSTLVRAHCKPEVFFYTLTSTSDLNSLKRSETDQEGEKPSLGQ